MSLEVSSTEDAPVRVVRARRAPSRPVALGYQRSLDGLRGLAVLAVVMYHSGTGVTPGGFLGVSTFFTLSGFLITSLMVGEHARSGRVSLRAFWERRLRRLMPAALLTISAITVAAIWLADTTQWLRLRPDALASTFYVANWRFLLAGDSYGAMFQSPSPFTHFWSLAIEEQFYLVLPLVVVAALAASRGSRRVLAALFAGAVVASVLWANWLLASGAQLDRLYFGTEVRAPELLVGSLLGLWWMRRDEPLGPRGARVMVWAGPPALIAVVACWVFVELDDEFLYRGGFTGYSLLTVVVVVAAVVPRGPLNRMLRWRPLVWVGLVSYAVYLFHFPVFVWMRQYLDIGDWMVLGVGLAATLVAAALSGRFVERPARKGRRRGAARVYLYAAGGLAVVAVLIVFVTSEFNTQVSEGDAVTLDREEAWERFLDQTERQAESKAPQIRFYGDSTALLTAMGMSTESRERPDEFVSEGGYVELGCGLVAGTRRRMGDQVTDIPEECDGWLETWAQAASEDPGDVAVIQLGPWEVADQQLTASGPFLSIDESEELRAAFVDLLGRAVDELARHHSTVVLLSPPDVVFGRIDGRDPREPIEQSDPVRMQRFREVVAEVAASREGVEVIDLAGWVAASPDDSTLRPDGVHFSNDAAPEVAKWLYPQVLAAYEANTGRTDSSLPG